MVTMGTEVAASIERLSGELAETKADLQALMDDLVAAASGHGPGSSAAARVAVELGRVHTELQSLKRRLPVRAKDFDLAEIADHVADAVLLALSGELAAPPKPRATKRKAEPVKAEPAKSRRRPLRAD
jgi:hypothetical protein